MDGARQHAGQDQPRPLAAGKFADRRARLLRLEQEILHIGDDVLLLAIDHKGLAAPVGQEMRQRLVGIDGPLLVERGDLQIGAEPHRPGVGRQRAGQHAEQRRLAGAVGADQPDPRAAGDAGREIVDHGEVAIALADRLCLDHQPAGFGRLAGRQVRPSPSAPRWPRRRWRMS